MDNEQTLYAAALGSRTLSVRITLGSPFLPAAQAVLMVARPRNGLPTDSNQRPALLFLRSTLSHFSHITIHLTAP